MRKLLTEEEFLDKWLTDNYGTTIKQVMKDHPYFTKDDPDYNTRYFYNTYPVTQEAHDVWYDWAIERIMKHFKLGKKRAKRHFCFDYLNVAPKIKKGE